jgi:hypothetical protein
MSKRRHSNMKPDDNVINKRTRCSMEPPLEYTVPELERAFTIYRVDGLPVDLSFSEQRIALIICSPVHDRTYVLKANIENYLALGFYVVLLFNQC